MTNVNVVHTICEKNGAVKVRMYAAVAGDRLARNMAYANSVRERNTNVGLVASIQVMHNT